MVLALVYFQRFAKPAAYTFAGCGFLMLGMIGFVFFQGYAIESLREHGGARDQFERQMLVARIAYTACRVIGFSLLLAAVFSGRRTHADFGGMSPSIPKSRGQQW
jgi:hypothetical protein